MSKKKICIVAVAAVLTIIAVIIVVMVVKKKDEDGGDEESMNSVHELSSISISNLSMQGDTISYHLDSSESKKYQSSYQIVMASTKEKLEAGEYDIWNSDKVESSANYGITYGGNKLSSMQGVYYKVRVWDELDNPSEYSDVAYYETGLLENKDWEASWIEANSGSSEGKIGSNVIVTKVTSTNSRYMKLLISESGPASIDEYNDAGLGGKIYRAQIMDIELYKDNQKVNTSNVKVKADNSFTWGNKWSKDFLFDGDKNTGYTSNNVAKRIYGTPIEIVFDYGENISYDEIRVYCRKDSMSTEDNVCPNYIKKFIYKASADGSTYSDICSEVNITEPPKLEEEQNSGAKIMSTEFSTENKKVEKARMYVSGLGIYEAHMNGVNLDANAYFNPGESDARDTIYYCSYDITSVVNNSAEKGYKNAVSIILGNGQYRNFRIHMQNGRYYKIDDARNESDAAGMFGECKLLAEIVLAYTDGTREIVGTNDKWVYTDSPITENSWYGGEDYDARLEMDGYDNVSPSVPRSEWSKVAIVAQEEQPTGKLIEREYESVQIIEEDTITSDKIKVEQIDEKNGSRRYLVDMGRNGAGFPEITLSGVEKGTKIVMYPAENKTMNGFQGHINQESCTQSASKNGSLIYDTYIAKGAEKEVYHPRFCYHGYRYVEVVVPDNIVLSSENFKGYILRVNNEKSGSFSCSDETLNTINTLTERSIESNMYNTFTDCPQIEKLGWLETPSLMFDSMAQTYKIDTWIKKIIRDMVDSQSANGRIAAIAPEYYRINGLTDDLNWNGSIILTAWQYYETYGDKSVFEDEYYNAMSKYMTYLKNNVAKGNLISTGQMGEWGEMTNKGKTPVILVETTAYYRFATTMTKIAKVLGKDADISYYQGLADDIQKAFHNNKECYNETNIYGNGTQSSYGCVLYSGIVLPENIEKTVNRLVEVIEKNNYHLTSGEVGLKQVFCSLAENGRSDVVYKMVTADTMPSYKYFITKGLTTLPEYWNFEDLWGSVARSQNHAMMGHVKEWLVKYLGGVKNSDICYNSFIVKPSMIDGITCAKVSVPTVHGNIEESWEYDKSSGIFCMKLTVPFGTKAKIYVPIKDSSMKVLVNGTETSITIEDSYITLVDMLESGEYTITLSK